MSNFILLSSGIAGWWASIEDAMAEAGINSLIGIVVVFAALFFISFIISLFKYISILENKFKGNKKENTAPTQTSAQPAVSAALQGENVANDHELIAVITAAIHAYEAAQGNEIPGNLVVRSIRKRNSKWQNA